MNENVLILTILDNLNVNEFNLNIDRLGERYKNILILNEGKNNNKLHGNSVTKEELINYLNNNKIINTVVVIKNIKNISIEDINNSIINLKNSNKEVIVTAKENNKIINIFNNTLNMLFNANFKNDRVCLYIFTTDSLKTHLNGLKTDDYNIQLISDKLILKNESESVSVLNNTSNLNKSYISDVLNIIIKGIAPYIITLFLFLIIFYLINSTNDLSGILISNLISEGVGVVLHYIINYKLIYKNNTIKNNIIYILRKIIRILTSIILIYILYNMIESLLLSKIIVDLILIVVITTLFKIYYRPTFVNRG